MTVVAVLPRELLAQVLGGNRRAVAGFEQLAQQVDQTSDTVASQAADTQAIQQATVLTLSRNEEFQNERVFRVSAPGLTLIDDGEFVTIGLGKGAAKVANGYDVQFIGEGQTSLYLPTTGRLATTDQPEMLTQKTLNAPRLSGLGDYADDAAAAAASVPVGGIYRTGSALKVRVA